MADRVARAGGVLVLLYGVAGILFGDLWSGVAVAVVGLATVLPRDRTQPDRIITRREYYLYGALWGTIGLGMTGTGVAVLLGYLRGGAALGVIGVLLGIVILALSWLTVRSPRHVDE